MIAFMSVSLMAVERIEMSDTIQTYRNKINAFADEVRALVEKHDIGYVVMAIECATNLDGDDPPIVTGQVHVGDVRRRAILAGAILGRIQMEYRNAAEDSILKAFQNDIEIGRATRGKKC